MRHQGLRTLGVVTKIDLARLERGALYSKLMMAADHDVKLRLGFIPVRNRTPDDASAAAARAKEASLFEGASELAALPAAARGTRALVAQLVRLQVLF